MKTIVPFFGNTRDNTHCYQASIRMILKHFLPKKNFAWKELERLSAKKKGKWTWQTQMILNLRTMGFDIVVMDAFDYDAFIKKGGPFLIDIWGEEMGNAQIKNSDIEQERQLFRIYKKEIDVEKRPPTFRDITRLLKQGYLLESNVNSVVLNRSKGYAGHSVVIYGMDKNYVYLHDPGLPPRPARKVSRALFKKAWMYPSKGSQTLTGIRLPSS